MTIFTITTNLSSIQGNFCLLYTSEVGFMQEGKTIGQLMEEMRQKAGAQNYHGHDYMDLQRFAENTRHMIDVYKRQA